MPPNSVEVVIEDRLTQRGPFGLRVRPATQTLAQLKQLMEDQHGVDVGLQRWIIDRRLATDDGQTLHQLGFTYPGDASLFLYLVAPGNRTSFLFSKTIDIFKN